MGIGVGIIEGGIAPGLHSGKTYNGKIWWCHPANCCCSFLFILKKKIHCCSSIMYSSAYCLSCILCQLSISQCRVYVVVTCVIMQKNGAGLHTASSCFWDNSTDGQYVLPPGCHKYIDEYVLITISCRGYLSGLCPILIQMDYRADRFSKLGN